MKLTFRWYGEKDCIPLNYIKQIFEGVEKDLRGKKRLNNTKRDKVCKT